MPGPQKRSVFSQPSVIMENSRIKIVSKKLSNRIKDGIKEVKPIKSEKDQREQNYRIKGGFRQ